MPCDHLVHIEWRLVQSGSNQRVHGPHRAPHGRGRSHAAALAAYLEERGYSYREGLHILEVDISDDGAYDVIRDGVASLGLGLVRLEQRRRQPGDLFRDEADAGARACLSRPPRAASTTSATATTTGRGPPVGTFATLYTSSLRSAFGFGRRTSSKIIPFTLAVFAFIPASSRSGSARSRAPPTPTSRSSSTRTTSATSRSFSCSSARRSPSWPRPAQRPDLSLYFSRALSRVDYAPARFAALSSVMLVLTLGPQVLLYVGNGLAADDLSATSPTAGI